MERRTRSKTAMAAIMSMMLLSVIFLLAAPVNSEGTRAVTSPQWPTFKGSNDRSGKTDYKIGNNQGEILWKTRTSPVKNSSLAIGSDGTLYIGTEHNQVYALSPEGRIEWTYLTDGEVRSSPSIDNNGLIYFGSLDSNLYCIDPDGGLEWMISLDDPITGTPLVTYDAVYVGTQGGMVYGINKGGNLVWNFSTNGSINSSPALYHNGRILVTSNDGYMYCLGTDGAFNWKYWAGDLTDSTPAVGEVGGVFVTSDEGTLQFVNSLGDQVWSYTISDTGWASPSSYDEYQAVIGTTSGYIHRVGSYGHAEWKYSVSSRVTTSTIVSGDGFVVFGTQNGYVICMDDKGSIKWSAKLDSSVASTPAIDEQGDIYVADSSGNIYRIGTKPREAPSPPRNLEIEVGDLYCKVSWEEPEHDGNETIEGYSIIRWDETTEERGYIGQTDRYGLAYMDIFVEYYHTYHYTIVAINSIGESDESDEVIGTPFEESRLPGPPTQVSHSVNGYKITLQWAPPEDEGTSKVDNYRVYRYDAFGNVEKESVVLTDLFYTEQVPELDTYYYYRVTAISEVGEGPTSSMARVFVVDEERVDWGAPSSQEQESDSGSDAAALICCLFTLFGVVGVPIILIIIITKAMKSADEKKKAAGSWAASRSYEKTAPVPWPGGVDIRTGRSTPTTLSRTSPSVDQQEESIKAISWDERVPPPAAPSAKVEAGKEEPLIEMVLGKEEPEEIFRVPGTKTRADLSSFERPAPMSDIDKDEFIVDRIMELKEMLDDGEIDKEMYDTLRKRLVDQLDR
ncbi:MAG: PQQ-binding-like beta-propeller repeat protein [Thermoplasmatota archaeon]